jgi:3-methyladenine DNA glycosylase AlkD
VTRFDAGAVADEITRGLRAAGTAERAAWDKGYLKSELEHLGVKLPDQRRIAREVWKRYAPGREELVALVEALWETRLHDRRAQAVILLARGAKLLQADDLPLVERLLRESRTWALVDELATHVAGSLVEREPRLGRTLDRWARDDDFWIRRSALLALLRPLRAGGGDFERFARYADGMLEEKEFFVRKAIGWLLREVSKKRPELVAEWLAPRARRASGLTVREAVKNLPAKMRAQVMASRG